MSKQPACIPLTVPRTMSSIHTPPAIKVKDYIPPIITKNHNSIHQKNPVELSKVARARWPNPTWANFGPEALLSQNFGPFSMCVSNPSFGLKNPKILALRIWPKSPNFGPRASLSTLLLSSRTQLSTLSHSFFTCLVSSRVLHLNCTASCMPYSVAKCKQLRF